MDTSIILPRSVIHRRHGSPLMAHQELTRDAFDHADVVINDSATASGKTLASLQYLHTLAAHLPQVTRHGKTQYEYGAVLYVAPINELLHQTFDAIVNYVAEKQLPFNVFPITGTTMKTLKQILEKRDGRVYTSNGELFEMLLSDPVSIVASLASISSHEIQLITRPFIFVINPDILYYMLLQDTYYRRFQANIQFKLFSNTRYVVFDEFHYYTFDQLHAFFTMCALWKITGRFNDTPASIKLCLLSATPNPYIADRLTHILGLRCCEINEDVVMRTPTALEAVPFLTETHLFIHPRDVATSFHREMTKTSVSEIIVRDVTAGKYVLIICDSLHQVNLLYHAYHHLLGNRVARITGAITSSDRKSAVNRPLLIATATVDIGFNFNRDPAPDRQEIDSIWFEFGTYDQFAQRIGRVGRILRKTITDDITTAHIFLPPQEYALVCAMFRQSTFTTRSAILAQFRRILPEKDYHRYYFERYGILVAQNFLHDFRRHSLVQYPDDASPVRDGIIAQLDQLQTYYYHIYHVNATEEQRGIQFIMNIHRGIQKITVDNQCFTDLSPFLQNKIVYDCICNNTYHIMDNGMTGNQFVVEQLLRRNPTLSHPMIYSQVKEIASRTTTNPCERNAFVRMYDRYLRSCIIYRSVFFRAIFHTFRGNGFGASVSVIDPRELLGSHTTAYDFFHIVRYYRFTPSHHNANTVEIQDILPTPRDITFEFTFNTLTAEQFEGTDTPIHQRLWKYWVFSSLPDPTYSGDQPYLPRSFLQLLHQPHIAYVTYGDDAGWRGVMHTYGISDLHAFRACIHFKANDTRVYRIFFDKDAVMCDAAVRGHACASNDHVMIPIEEFPPPTLLIGDDLA